LLNVHSDPPQRIKFLSVMPPWGSVILRFRLFFVELNALTQERFAMTYCIIS